MTSVRPYLQIRSHSEILEVGTSAYKWGAQFRHHRRHPSRLVHPTVYLGLSLRESKSNDFQLNPTPVTRRAQLQAKPGPLLGLRRWCVLQSGEAGLQRACFDLGDCIASWSEMTPKRTGRRVATGKEHGICRTDISSNLYKIHIFGENKIDFKLKQLKKPFLFFKCFWVLEHKQCCLATWLVEKNTVLASPPRTAQLGALTAPRTQ